jgi:hypothetical protein
MNGGWAGQPGTGLARRLVPGAKGGRAAGTAGSSVVGFDMAGEARQWQHAGNSVGKKDTAGPDVRRAHSRDRGCVRCACIRRALEERCAVCVARVLDLSLYSTILKLCTVTSECGCSGAYTTWHLYMIRADGVRASGRCVPHVRKVSPSRGRVVEKQRGVQRTPRRKHTPAFLCPCGLWQVRLDGLLTPHRPLQPPQAGSGGCGRRGGGGNSAAGASK